jgi:hypothetical protein
MFFKFNLRFRLASFGFLLLSSSLIAQKDVFYWYQGEKIFLSIDSTQVTTQIDPESKQPFTADPDLEYLQLGDGYLKVSIKENGIEEAEHLISGLSNRKYNVYKNNKGAWLFKGMARECLWSKCVLSNLH